MSNKNTNIKVEKSVLSITPNVSFQLDFVKFFNYLRLTLDIKHLNDFISSRYEQLQNITVGIYAEIEYNMHIFLINIFNEFHNKDISPILNLLYFHNSIVSIKKRSKETSKKDCECTLHPGYLLDKTGFICQEDFFVPIEILKDLSSDSNEDIFNNKTNDKQVFKQYIKPLINSNKKHITFDKFYSFFVSKERFKASLEIFKKEKTKITEKSSGWCLLG